MEFSTKVELPDAKQKITYADRLMLWGSCFTEHIGELLQSYKLDCCVNPMGILYNPSSIARGLKQVCEGKRYTTEDLMQHNGRWFSLMHHSAFSSSDSVETLTRINDSLERAEEYLKQAGWIIFTWGTARIYEWSTTGEVVGNCHKLPERNFNRRLLEVHEIVSEYQSLLQRIRTLNPKVQFLFTVSPIRHSKDGMHGNQLSKATLLLAIDRLCTLHDCCHYFPSYEIMMDELRDYRFYADDMLHPSAIAVQYIWECFCKTCFSEDTRRVMQLWEEVRKGLSHRPFDASSAAYQRFLSQILLKIEGLKEKMPYLDVQNEIDICQARLKK